MDGDSIPRCHNPLYVSMSARQADDDPSDENLLCIYRAFRRALFAFDGRFAAHDELLRR